MMRNGKGRLENMIGSVEPLHTVRRLFLPSILVMAMIMMGIPAVVTDASTTTWSAPLHVSATPGERHLAADIEKGGNYFYALDWMYSNGPVKVRRSPDAVTWSSPVDIFNGWIYVAEPGMYVYRCGDSDHIIVTSLASSQTVPGSETAVAKSVDNGTIFTRLTNISVPLVYSSVAANATWFEGKIDSILYVVGTVYTGGSGGEIVIVRSTDNGTTWGTPNTITSDLSYFTRLMRYGDSLYCFYQLKADRNVYIRSSDDWGNTWSAATLVYTKVNGFAAQPCGLQRLDKDKCLMTISDLCAVNPDPAARGVYGYFWLENKTFQQVGYYDNPPYVGQEFDGLVVTSGGVTTFYALYTGCVNAAQTDIVLVKSTDTGLCPIAPYGYSGAVHALPESWIRMDITWSGYTIVIKTNSSVLGVSFDKDKRSLEMSVNGAPGTHGVCLITIPKAMIQSKSNISVSLDKHNLNFNLTENATQYMINITYSQTTTAHDLTTEFAYSGATGGEVPPAASWDLIMIAAIAIAALALIGVSVLLIRRGKKT